MHGPNKLLEPLAGKPIVAHVVDRVLAAGVAPVVVVTGHESQRVAAAVADRAITVIQNPRWSEGMSTSVAAGVAALEDLVDGALICLGDMPRVSTDDVVALVDAFGSSVSDPSRSTEANRGGTNCDLGRPARAAPAAWVPVHARQRGNPVLWSAAWFGALLELQGDRGAKGLLTELGDQVVEVPAGEGVLVDLDTADELEKARNVKG
jgi:molybdenum cofactor cytidylyltransferase